MVDKKNILITGCAGLIGARFADWVIEHHPEYNVVGIDSMFGGYIENVNDKVIFHKRDLAVDPIMDLFEAYRFEYVFHFAAYAPEGLSPFIRKFNYSNNMVSTANIVNECVNYDVKRLVYTSSMAVYGEGIKPGERFDENDICLPVDPYGISKYACEMDIRCAGNQHGLDWCIIRPHNVFGVKQNIWDKYRNVLGIWINDSLNGRPITVYGDGQQTRAFTYIDNILEPLWVAAASEGASKEIINLGGMHGTSLNDAANMVSRITGNTNIVHAEARNEVKHAIPSFQKSIDKLGYDEHYSVEYGIMEMYKWAKTQPNRSQFKWDEYEINKGIYSYWK